MLVVDEADAFAPQRPQKGEERLLGAMEDLVRRGRARGLGVMLVTQRSAVLNKNVLTQIECLIVMRTTSPQDRKAIKAWVDVHGEEDEWREMDNALPKLDIGTAYIWSPGWLDVFKQINVRLRRTFDSSATPKVGEKRIVPTNRAEPDLESLRERIASTIEEAKRNDPAELRKRIRELESEVAKKPEVVEAEAPEPQIIEVAVFPKPLKDAIHRMLTGFAMGVLDNARAAAKDAEDMLDNLDANFELAIEMQEAPPTPPIDVPTTASTTASIPTKPRPDLDALPKAQPELDGPLTGPQQRVLDSLAWLEAVGFDQPTKIQCGFIAGYRVGKNVGGTYGNILGQLRSAGLLDYPKQGRVCLTAEGRGTANLPDIEQTTAGLQKAIYDRLTAPEEKVMRVLVDVYPKALTKQECGARSGYTVGPNVGGTFGNILGKLRTLGLADYPQRGMVAATSVLFIG
jgi:plasmid stabilization system protein ParE